MGKLLGAGKRVLTGESLFMTAFGNQRQGKRRRSPSPRPTPARSSRWTSPKLGGRLICQKDSFLVRARKGVSTRHRVAEEARRRASSAARASSCSGSQGDGLALRARRRHARRAELMAPGETLRVDTGCLVAFEPCVDLRHPVRRRVQDRAVRRRGALLRHAHAARARSGCSRSPSAASPSRIFAAAPQRGGSKEEGSLLGSIGGAIMGGDS